MKRSLWNSVELCKAVNGKSNSNKFWDAFSISLDSRKVKKGGVFFAIDGKNNNGHDYILKAFQNGAIASVVNATSKCILEDNNIIEGSPDKIKFVTDIWKFTKNIKNDSPNWYLAEIISQ